ncbi:cytochrome C oxidase subunit II [bacterium]|nr:cytochrome C oxidase subunit II [bacterium]
MARGSYLKGPNYVHPERGSAVGSRNSLNRDGRNEYAEAKLLIDEEVDKVLNHVTNKLPPEVLEKIHVGGTVKEVLHNYYNQSYHNMYNRYMTSVEDEMGKKFRDLVDKEEAQNLNKYNPRDVSYLLDSIGKEGMFNTDSMENSVVNIFGHLQGHIQKRAFDLEDNTRKLLSGKTGVGGFLRGKFAGSVVKCSFSNNTLKPDTVTDVDLVLSIPESTLVRPIYHYQAASETIVKDIISEHVITLINKEVHKIDEELKDSRQNILNQEKRVFEKVKKLEDHIGFGDDSNDSPQYAHMAKKFVDAIKGIGPELNAIDHDPLDIRENVLRLISEENIRDRGFNNAVNKLVGLLDISLLGYQHIENFKNCRKVVVREYEDTNKPLLPDEHYAVTLTFLDDLQLRELRTAFCQQLDDFVYETDKLRKVFEKIHENEKVEQSFKDYEDIASEILNEVNRSKSKSAQVEELPRAELWDEITFVQPKVADIEKLNETYIQQKSHLKKQFNILRDRIANLYENANPPERVILEQRLDFLQDEILRFDKQFNPFQVYPGLFVEVSFASINRRDQTTSRMGNVLTQFLNEIATDIPDFAHTEFHERHAGQEKTPGAFASIV